jgi:hypothetical protein
MTRGSPFPLALLVLLGMLHLSLAQEAVEQSPPALNPNPLSGLDLESLTATRSLPLFTPSRTAPPTVEESVEAAEVVPIEPQGDPELPPPSVQLVGIMLSETTETALLLDPTSNEVHRLITGEEYDGWLLKIVDARSVELRNGDRVEGLKMFESFPAPQPLDGMQMDIPIDGVPPGMEMEPGMEMQPEAEQFPPDESTGALNPEELPPDIAPGFAPDEGSAQIPEEGPLPPDLEQNADQ